VKFIIETVESGISYVKCSHTAIKRRKSKFYEPRKGCVFFRHKYHANPQSEKCTLHAAHYADTNLEYSDWGRKKRIIQSVYPNAKMDN